MDYKVIFTLVCMCGVYVDSIQGTVTCFRKYRKKRDNCGGLIKKKIYTTAEACCAGKGRGYTVKELTMLSRNKYQCVSCAAERPVVPLSPPRNVRAHSQGSSVMVEWDKPEVASGAILGYRVYYNRHKESPLVLWSQKVVDTDSTVANIYMSKNQTYYVTVGAFGAVGDGPLSEVIVVKTIDGEPESQPPRNLRVEPKSPNEIHVQWEPPTDQDSADSYTLYYKESFSHQTGEVTVTAASTSHTLTDLVPDTMYYIRLEGRNRRGEPAKTDIVKVRTPAYIPGEPELVRIKVINSSAIDVAWKAPIRKEGDGIIRGYNVYYSESTEDDDGTETSKDTMDGEKRHIVITGLQPGTSYSVSVSGYTRKGDGIRSRSKLTTTTGSSHVGTFVCFRKYRPKKQTCGGPIPNSVFPSVSPNSLTPEICCSRRGMGFSTSGKEKLRKNVYTCTSCEEWRRSNDTMTSTTPSPTTTTSAPADWGHWGQCSTSCGAGWRTRFRAGGNTFTNMESKPCIVTYYCPIDGNWSDWATWADCTSSCGGGTRQRRRMCDFPSPKYGGQLCTGNDVDEESCNEEPCPVSVDGHWSQWSRFGYCSSTCGIGHMVRTRECGNPAPKGSGAPCRGLAIEERRCERRKCPRHGGWSSWESWSSCPVTCGSGVRTRLRVCDRPRPLFGGRKCDGSPKETEACQAPVPCPIDGGWSAWSSYGHCRGPPCGKGHQLRSRSCDSPRPRHRGRLCRGRSVERQECMNMADCRGAPSAPIHGGWCEFGPWSGCSVSCSFQSGYQIRFRECRCPLPRDRGDYCRGDSRSVQNCTVTGICDGPSVDLGV